jgi:hypothetical protein
MSIAASIAVQTLRAEQRQLSHGPMMPRLWQAMRGEWQRRQDRKTAAVVRALDHVGVREDYRMACRPSYR